ncbi:MAG TPA: NADH-quinone oxidoreductase subunit J [bacterium]|nr:NADH-quinone oxidoreductase subunit J [bacterium]
MANTLFYVVAGIIVASALMAMTLRNLFHCALFLALTMFGISGIFLYLNSEFIAAVQVLIYVGAVTVLLIFGIMLTRNVMDEKTRVMNNQVFLALVTAGVITVIVFAAVHQSTFQLNDHPLAAAASIAPDHTDVYSLGIELIRPEKGFAFAFEFVSVLLLSALVGAIVVARKDPS